MDALSFTVANLLVANEPDDAGLETTLIGPELEALASASIAITGGNSSPRINGEPAAMWQTVNIHEGDILSFGKMESGCRSYLAVSGGIRVPMILGSRSTYVRGGFGGLDGRRLTTGDIIKSFVSRQMNAKYAMPKELVPQFARSFSVGAMLGPQADMFTQGGIDSFFSSQYTVSPEADRMGLRLEGPSVQHVAGGDIISDALLPGAVQVPRNGKPIVVMKDAQTTGGYPKIAIVVSSDLSMLGQAKANDTIEFSRVTLEEAQEKLKQQRVSLRNLSKMLLESQ
jgi:biotin-dependent carboxylase-like uncharacterized protein